MESVFLDEPHCIVTDFFVYVMADHESFLMDNDIA